MRGWSAFSILAFFCGIASINATAFETTKVMPRGIRSLIFKSLTTSINDKTDSQGVPHPLAEPLEKPATFKDMIKETTGTKKLLLRALIHDKFANQDSVGAYSSEMKGNLSAFIPIFSYGMTDNLTFAVAVPFYHAKMGVKIGYTPSENAVKFKKLLLDENTKSTAKAQEFTDKMNHAVRELNNKLHQHGYASLDNWEGSGTGDTNLVAKYHMFTRGAFSMASSTGLILPTGRVQDPDVLMSMPFGDGIFAAFYELISDEDLGHGFFLNQFAKFTYQKADHRHLRVKSEEDPIEVGKEDVSFKLGNKIDMGTSIQYDAPFGLLAGLGFTYSKKYADRYRLQDYYASEQEWEKDTGQMSDYIETKIGYSSIPAVLRKQFLLPIMIYAEYKKQIKSVNTAKNDLFSIDMAFFF
jgi:hypothetical protein